MVPHGLLYNPRYPTKAQKTKGILNVFGAYDHTNNKMWTHGYKQKTGKHKTLSNYYPNFQSLRNMISQYYRIEIRLGFQKVSTQVHELMF